MVFTYQHTCRSGQIAYILKSAPFKAPIVKRGGKTHIPFLGEGYYLWEENIEAAKRWGKKQYGSNYCIVEYQDINLEGEDILDFQNRRHSMFFQKLQSKYKGRYPESVHWDLGTWIEFFKKLNKTTPGIFPFNFIRADENLPNNEENDRLKQKTLFSTGLGYYTYLSPLMILCVIDKKKINCKGKNVL